MLSNSNKVIDNELPASHYIHLHGHNFDMLAQAASTTYCTSVKLNLDDAPRRDMATLPASGHLPFSF